MYCSCMIGCRNKLELSRVHEDPSQSSDLYSSLKCKSIPEISIPESEMVEIPKRTNIDVNVGTQLSPRTEWVFLN